MAVKQIARCAVLTTAALIFGYVESWIPVQAFIPLPGIKLGLANIVVLTAVLTVGAGEAFVILVLRCTITAMLFGNVTSLIFSMSGGAAALAVTVLMVRLGLYGSRLSEVGISVSGAAMHNTCQIAAAAVLFGSWEIVYYLPLLLWVSVITGVVTGTAAKLTIRAVKRIL